jgi:hypothetical protein
MMPIDIGRRAFRGNTLGRTDFGFDTTNRKSAGLENPKGLRGSRLRAAGMLYPG